MTWKTWRSYPPHKQRGLKGVAAFWLLILLWVCFPTPVTHMVVGLFVLGIALYMAGVLSHLIYELVSGTF